VAETQKHLSGPLRGRGTSLAPTGRFERLSIGAEPDAAADEEAPSPATHYLRDASRSVLSRNQSPDVGFETSLNPYRGCEHGCIYCYARPTHEYLGLSAGLDFETRILVKEQAPELLQRALVSPAWSPQVIALSGVTDPYQPIERRLQLTRRCLAVLAAFRNPVAVITKSRLIARDADLLSELARHDAASVTLSITTLDAALARVMEPRAAQPRARLSAIAELAAARVPVGISIGPVVPGLTDHEIPDIAAAAAAAGAGFATFIVLRLPYGVKDLFQSWLEDHFPERRSKVLSRIRALRSGKLNTNAFGERMKGTGVFAEQIRELFHLSCRRAGLATRGPELSTLAFRRTASHQLELF
jgi:DNA repair photolyase